MLTVCEVVYFILYDLVIKAGLGDAESSIDGASSSSTLSIGSIYDRASQYPVQIA